jgi:3-oxoacyl-[acyl-carrier-protein] synthase II
MDIMHMINSSRDVVVSSWGAVYGDFSEFALTRAAFEDVDLLPHVLPCSSTRYDDISTREKKIFTPNLLSPLLAIEKAWENAKLCDDRNELLSKHINVRHPKTAIVAGSSLGMLDNVSQQLEQIPSKLSPYTMSRLRGNSMTVPFAIRFGLGAGDFSLSAASATGGQAMWMAGNLIQLGAADQVVALCTDTLNSTLTRQALQAMGATAKSTHSRPLTCTRSGMRPMSASAAIILETAESACKRNHTPLARWLGGSIKNECYHVVAPEPTGNALKEAHAEILGKTGLETSNIDWLSMHATGTKVWDSIEAHVIKALFGETLPHLSAFKRTFGHTLSVAGILETAMLVEGLSSGCLPQWPDDIDPAFNLKKPSHVTTARHAMSWGIGMGGTVAMNLFSKL